MTIATTAPAIATIPAPEALLVGQDLAIPLRNGQVTRPINFDHAASTPALQAVRETVDRFLNWYSSVHRGTGFTSQLSTQAYEDARAIVGRFVGACLDQHVVIFGANTTWALNKLARRLNFQPGEVVITSQLEHHANDLPWRQVATVTYARCDSQGRLDLDHLRTLLRRHAGKVRLVSITGGSNVTGHIPDLATIATLAHAAGAQFAVDAAQLAPHRAIDLGDLSDPTHIDYVAFSGHKLYAPYGSGVLIGRRDTFANGIPESVGGGTVRRVTADTVEWASTPARDEAGTPNVVGAVALAAATQALQQIGFAALAEHETQLTALALRELGRMPGIQIYGDPRPETAHKRLGVIPFRIEGLDHRLVAAILSYEYGIAVRAGAFCAHPYVQHLIESDASCREDAPAGLVRASIGLATTEEDVLRLSAALRTIATQGTRSDYHYDATHGSYHPADWQPNLAAAFSF
ncbi:MAG: aminotransferase class V-fold PLP-dependent enzyme [Roseiflexaceae bacterium]